MVRHAHFLVFALFLLAGCSLMEMTEGNARATALEYAKHHTLAGIGYLTEVDYMHVEKTEDQFKVCIWLKMKNDEWLITPVAYGNSVVYVNLYTGSIDRYTRNMSECQ